MGIPASSERVDKALRRLGSRVRDAWRPPAWARRDLRDPGALGGALQRELERCVEAWFPRCIDREHDGFLCDFDRRWEPNGPQHKMLEFQARQTRAAAQAYLHDPRLAVCREAAEHGFHFLKSVMWDGELGGWYQLVDRDGQVLEQGVKHGHGHSYAVQACIEHHRMTGRAESLELARRAFDWLDRHAHDAAYGGYFPYLRRDGTPITRPGDDPRGSGEVDVIGYPLGQRDENTPLDLLEALADLYAVDPRSGLRERLRELLSINLERVIVEPAVVGRSFHRDWTPVEGRVKIVIGHSLQAVSIVIKAAHALGEPDAAVRARRAARRMLDNCMRYAWDRQQGGFYTMAVLRDGRVTAKRAGKGWWEQAEGLRALLWHGVNDPRGRRYRVHWLQLWRYITERLIDDEHGGWLMAGRDTGKRNMAKGSRWKDCSHEVRALIDCQQLLAAWSGRDAGPRPRGRPAGA